MSTVSWIATSRAQKLPHRSRRGLEGARGGGGRHRYELSRRAERNLFSFAYIFGQSGAKVRDDGSLVVNGLDGLNGEPKKFREVQPWLWQEEHGEQRMAVTRDGKGRVVTLVPDGYGAIILLQRPPLWRNKAWLGPRSWWRAASLHSRC